MRARKQPCTPPRLPASPPRMSFDQFVGRPLRPDMPRKLMKALYNVKVVMLDGRGRRRTIKGVTERGANQVRACVRVCVCFGGTLECMGSKGVGMGGGGRGSSAERGLAWWRGWGKQQARKKRACVPQHCSLLLQSRAHPAHCACRPLPSPPQVTFYNDNEKKETTVAAYFAATGERRARAPHLLRLLLRQHASQRSLLPTHERARTRAHPALPRPRPRLPPRRPPAALPQPAVRERGPLVVQARVHPARDVRRGAGPAPHQAHAHADARDHQARGAEADGARGPLQGAAVRAQGALGQGPRVACARMHALNARPLPPPPVCPPRTRSATSSPP